MKGLGDLAEADWGGSLLSTLSGYLGATADILSRMSELREQQERHEDELARLRWEDEGGGLGVSHVVLQEPTSARVLLNSGNGREQQAVVYGVPPEFMGLIIRVASGEDVREDAIALLRELERYY